MKAKELYVKVVSAAAVFVLTVAVHILVFVNWPGTGASRAVGRVSFVVAVLAVQLMRRWDVRMYQEVAETSPSLYDAARSGSGMRLWGFWAAVAIHGVALLWVPPFIRQTGWMAFGVTLLVVLLTWAEARWCYRFKRRLESVPDPYNSGIAAVGAGFP